MSNSDDSSESDEVFWVGCGNDQAGDVVMMIVGDGIKVCPNVTVGQVNEMTKLEGEAIQRREGSKTKMVHLPSSMSCSSQSSSYSMPTSNPYFFRKDGYDPKKRKAGGDGPLGKAFNLQAREQLDGQIARMFYSGRFLFNLARNPHYVSAFSSTANTDIKGYVPPGEFKEKWFISSLIKEMILQVSVTNVVQVVTDNAPVCKAAGLLIEEIYPHIFWTPCVVHTLNLTLKNICAAKNTKANEITYVECHWITQISGTIIMIRNFINNHSMRLSMFNEFSKFKLLAIDETRLASSIVMLKRF
ncbi:hypothetical protein BUALT_Bualt05G0117200 [Buddleja alternifolia]|uniref:DUF659 domain-containing protein n=1 Tax=Buddleja alternifolia TaxID=168488 RepID=A0AAV6XK14_9LAMI|nr:hypothetical protein BUALT_Bualt05G0117200 [Buddleja alternifolia]